MHSPGNSQQLLKPEDPALRARAIDGTENGAHTRLHGVIDHGGEIGSDEDTVIDDEGRLSAREQSKRKSIGRMSEQREEDEDSAQGGRSDKRKTEEIVRERTEEFDRKRVRKTRGRSTKKGVDCETMTGEVSRFRDSKETAVIVSEPRRSLRLARK